MKIFRFILILALGLQVGFGADENGSSGSGQNVNDGYNYLKYQGNSIVNNGKCGECDAVLDGYVSRRYYYDVSTGTTYCYVYKESDLKEENFIGQTKRQVKSCATLNNISNETESMYNEAIKSYENRKEIKSSIGDKKYTTNLNDEHITFSKFMAGLLTLNPDIIDRNKTMEYGDLQSNKKTYKIGAISFGGNSDTDKETQKEINEKLEKAAKENTMDTFVLTNTLNGKFITNKTLSVLDSFNSKNMAYFNNLFANMSKIYQHLQIFIFILIGGFFVMQIGASKLQAYLENRGESEGKQPYLHKFYIPLLMIGIFFMPIPEGNGYQSTVMQNMIRYFAQYSTTIADMANSVGAKTYIDKIYATAGHLSPEKLDKLKKERENSKKETEFYKQVVEVDNKDIGERCFNSRAQQNTTYIGSHGGSIKYDNNGQVFYSCLDYGKDIMRFNEASARLNKLDNELKFISLYSSQYGNTLNKIDEYFTVRNKELGWIDAMLTPTAGILVEIFTLSQVTEAMKDYQKENIKERQIAIKQYFNNGNLEQSKESVKNQVGFKTKITDGVMGYIGGRMVYMMMPGAKELQSFLYQSFDMIYNVIKSIITGTVAYFGGFASAALTGIGLSWIGSVLDFIFGGVIEMSKVAFSYYAATILMEWTITMIPLLAISTACLVACIAYLVSLCKYFYISPFVTAWAMATKKTDKIIDFLLVGIAIFFKPTLIILFVYLALFMQTLVQDFFVFVSMEQFAAIESDWDNFHTNFITGAIGGLIQIFGMLAASYVAWRLIVSGPGWALSLIGLDGKHDDMVAGGLENNLAKRAFVA